MPMDIAHTGEHGKGIGTMKNHTKPVQMINAQPLMVAWCLIFALASCLTSWAENLASGRACLLEPSPNYALCASETDNMELTDGQFCPDEKTSIWTQPQAVGWSGGSGSIFITVDLGRETVFDRVAFHTAAGAADVRLPMLIDIEASLDGKNYHTICCLTSENHIPLPTADGYQRVKYEADMTAVTARHVRFRVVKAGGYFFGEELTVERVGKEAPVAVESFPAAPSDGELLKGIDKRFIQDCLRNRLKKDLAIVKAQMDGKSLKHSQELQKEFGRLEQAVRSESFASLGNFRTVVPMHPLQTAILKLHGAVMRDLGFAEAVVWTQDRFQSLLPYALPTEKASINSVNAYMMNGEKRGLTLQFTNASDRELAVRLESNGLQADLFQAVFMDSNALRTDAVALVPLSGTVKVPAGMTSQFYLRLRPVGLKAGRHSYPLTFSWDGGLHSVELALTIAKAEFPAKPQLSTGWWDYLDFGRRESSWLLTRNQLPQALALEQAAGVDTTFCEHGIGNVNHPNQLTLTPEGDLSEPLDFTAFDSWVAQWPDARNYVVYMALNPNSKFGDAAPGTPRFRRAVADWARQWEAHLLKSGPSPEHVVFQMLDEPHDDATWGATREWVKAVREGSRRLTLFTNPYASYPDIAVETVADIDILCPLSLLAREGDSTQNAIYARHLAAGKRLWLYICHCGPFTASPWYYRRQAWLAFRMGATGSFFWSLGDTAYQLDGWNHYAAKFVYFSPLIVSPNGLTITKHWEAAAEAVADYEYLAILRKLLAAHPNRKHEQLLKDALYATTKAWDSPEGCSLAEGYRLKMLSAIDELIDKK